MIKKYFIVALLFQVLLIIKANAQNIGIGTSSPSSTLDVSGTFGCTYLVSSFSGAAINQIFPFALDNTATVWLFNGATVVAGANFAVALPDATTLKGRMYIVVNQTTMGGSLAPSPVFTISAFTDLTNTSVTTIAHNSSIQIISDGKSWLQIL